MTSEMSDLRAVRLSLEKVERNKRAIRQAGAVVLLLFGSIVVWSFTRSRTVEAERFVVRDGNGKMWAELSADSDGSFLHLFGPNGNVRVAVTSTAEGPTIVLFDEKMQHRAELALRPGGPTLLFYDQDGKGRVALGNTVLGPGLLLSDGNGNGRIVADLHRNGHPRKVSVNQASRE